MLSVAGATSIGAGASFTGGLIGNILNYDVANRNLEFQRQANEQNIALTREINNQNIAFQQNENAITRAREDNAVQRAAADMTAAGLSKTLAAGNPASAQALQAPSANTPQVKALNNQFKYESALQKMNIASLMQNMAEKEKELEMKEDYNNAQIDNMKADTALKMLNGETFMENFRNEQAIKTAQAFSFRMQAQESDARTQLTRIQGKYEARRLEVNINKEISEIFKNKSSFDLNYQQSKKIGYDIAESMAKIYKFGFETRLLIQDIAQAKIVNASKKWDLLYAGKYNLPVGSLLNGNIAQYINIMRSMGGSDAVWHPGEVPVLGSDGKIHFTSTNFGPTLTVDNLDQWLL